jgi:hypothetical protein
VGLTTTEPGQNEDGSPRYGTVNGSSAAAAVTAGAAALLAQARPSLGAAALKSLLVTSARPIRGEQIGIHGAGQVDLGRAAATELAVAPTTLALGEARRTGWSVRQRLRIRNASTRPVRVRIRVVRTSEGAAAVSFRRWPGGMLLRPGASGVVRMIARVASTPVGRAPAQGVVVVKPTGGAPLRVPWTITFGPRGRSLLGPMSLSVDSFAPSDAAPAVLTIQAGRIERGREGFEVRPLDRLDIELWQPDGDRLGLLARLRSVLPGRYSFGITGRGPAGQVLNRGRYRLRVIAVPTVRARASERSLTFRIR